MSVERTGRAATGTDCRWCGPRVETIRYEVRDLASGGIGSEVMCCLCGKHQYRWGWERDFWARETRKELFCGVLVTNWLAAQIILLAEQALGAEPCQLPLFEAVGQR